MQMANVARALTAGFLALSMAPNPSQPALSAKAQEVQPDLSVRLLVSEYNTAALRLLAAGRGVLVEDYGAFSLWDASGVDPALLSGLPDVVGREDFNRLTLRGAVIDTLPGRSKEPELPQGCLLYTSPSPRDRTRSRMPSSA